MKVCFPVQKNDGMDSIVYGHFGSAPAFIVVDTDGEGAVAVNNNDLHHVHGACNPVMAIGGREIDVVVVGGIGAGAIMKLNAQGVRVYASAAPTVKANLELLKQNRLQQISQQHACGGHRGGGCAH